MMYRKTIGASMFALGMAFAIPAMAASNTADPAASGADKPAVSAGAETQAFSEEKLASFAAAHKKVDELNKQYTSRAAGASDPTARQQVEQMKNIDLADAVKSEGLTTKEYNDIFMASKADPTLAAKIASLKETPAPQSSLQ